MKRIAASIAAIALFGVCLLGCSDEPPSVRVANQRGTKANVQFKQANANTINHNDVMPGTFSNFQDVAEGPVLVTAVIQNEAVSPSTAFTASRDNNYTVVVQAGDPPTLRVDTQGK